MSVSAIGGAATFVPLGVESRPPDQEQGDGRTDDITGSRATESDGSRRVVLARSGETENDTGREGSRPGSDGSAGALGDGRRGADGAAAEATVVAGGEDPSGLPGARQDEEEGSGLGLEELSDDEQRMVRELKARDTEVRAHEMAHVAAGGAHVTSGPNYTYQQGPDGKRYAIGGSVGIDTSAEDDPQATIAKMAQVRAAALAPAQPSGADRAVAAAAAATAAQARAELIEERTVEAEEARAERAGEDTTGVEGAEAAAGAGRAGIEAGAGETSNGDDQRGEASEGANAVDVATEPTQRAERSSDGEDGVATAGRRSEPGAAEDGVAGAGRGSGPAGEDVTSAPAVEPGVDDEAATASASVEDRRGTGLLDRAAALYQSTGAAPSMPTIDLAA